MMIELGRVTRETKALFYNIVSPDAVGQDQQPVPCLRDDQQVALCQLSDQRTDPNGHSYTKI